MLFQNRIFKIYDRILLKRRDWDGSMDYLSYRDFPGLVCKESEFLGDKGQRLCAYVYYEGEKRRDKIVIFEHGMGVGHVAYMQEIAVICRHGYTVFTYDHTGTRCSEGKNIGGFAQSVSDLERAVAHVRTLPDLKDARIIVIGHSWGGYSTMNIPALCDDVDCVVAMSGYISVKEIQAQAMGGMLRLYRRAVYKREVEAFPKYAHLDGRESLKNSSVRALIIHSRDDKTCSFKRHFLKLQSALSDSENVSFLALDGKNHHPTYSDEAIKYRNEYDREKRKKRKAGLLDTEEARISFAKNYDFERMSRQDSDVWRVIFDLIDNPT